MDTQWADGNDHYFQSKRKGQETISLVKSSVLPYDPHCEKDLRQIGIFLINQQNIR